MTNDLPPGWASVRLGEILTPRKGKHTPSPSDPRPYLSLDNIESHTSRISAWERSSDYSSQSSRLFAGDVAYARLRPYLNKTALLDREALGSAEFIVLPRAAEILPSFLCYRLIGHDFVRFADQHSTGDRPRLKWAQMRDFAIWLPPLAEQERIVAAIEEHLSRLNAADAALQTAKTRLEAIQRSAAATLFDRSDWTWTTLGEIAALRGGIAKDSKRESDPDHYEYPYLRVANVQRGFLDLSEVTVIRADPHKATRLVLQRGDILFNEGGDRDKLGRGWVWEGQIENCIHQNHVFRARLANSDFDPYFISMHANTWGQRWFETHGKQTTNLASINLTTLKSFPVPAPPLGEQQALVAELQTIMSSQHRVQAGLAQAERHSRTLRRSISSRAFSGQLVPQDPNDEPASVLLERVAPSRRAC